MIQFIVLGATGSIGKQTLDIIREDKNLKLLGFSFKNNLNKALEIIEEFKPKYVSLMNESHESIIKDKYPNIKVFCGTKGLVNLVSVNEEFKIVNALVGSVGLEPTYYGILNKKDILLANKETLVVAGEIIMPLAKENNVNIYPLDSEHSAIFQLLDDNNQKEIRRLIITASGGALRDYSRNELENVTKQEVLAHPNWQMGAKITVDCATMMNKGFEIIEAHYLFNVDIDNIEVLIHRSSIVHSMVEFNDYSICAQMASPDMHLPIHYAIYNKLHKKCDIIKQLPLDKLYHLSFEPLNNERYPLVAFAKQTLKKGGIYPCIMNAANEAIVKLFLDGKANFTDIERIIKEEVNNPDYNIYNQKELTINTLLELDQLVKNNVYNRKVG